MRTFGMIRGNRLSSGCRPAHACHWRRPKGFAILATARAAGTSKDRYGTVVSPSPASLEMIGKLIAFDTTSRNSNLELIGFVRDYLATLGVESRLVHDAEGRKANLYATLGPPEKPGIALPGHTDVVPIDGQEWSSDPWQVVRKDDRLYGRGACDMKGFLGIVLAHAPEFVKRGLHTPINLAFSYDEEIGCV